MKAPDTVKRLYRTRPMATRTEELIGQMRELKVENTRLQAQVKELEHRYTAERKLNQEMALRFGVLPSILQGRMGELLVADVSHGALMDYAAKFDVRTPENAKVEVKVSNAYDKSNEDYSESRQSYAKTYSWVWSNVLGSEDCPKKYDFLILIGVMPEEKWHKGVPELIYFFVHISEVEALTTAGSGGRPAIQLGTNFRSVRSVAKPLIGRIVTLAELESAIRAGLETQKV